MNIKHFLEAITPQNHINQLEINKFNVKSFQENHKDVIKIKNIVLNSQQRFRKEMGNLFTEVLPRFY